MYIRYLFDYHFISTNLNRVINPAFLEEEICSKTPDIVESHIKNNSVRQQAEISQRNNTSPSISEDELVDTQQVNDDLSTDVLKLQMYDEIVQRFGPDEQFSEMLRSQGTLDRFKTNNNTDLSISEHLTSPMTLEADVPIEHCTSSSNGKVEVLLMSQVPKTHRSSYRSLIISPNSS